MVGTLAYSWLQRLDFIGGTTLLLLIILGIGVLVTGHFTKLHPLMTPATKD
ncbi:hypothetical protein [Levilactobacillus suantsaii]|uniref:hypothetical protein n=1 Tax=Levilactobacillus suantsaii TaxID=2292255 RepID=UPI001CDD1354|nr:hypothetical protein [Levilactobacillus suantsaii]